MPKPPRYAFAVIGAEEQAPAVNVRTVARILGAPAFPVMPFPPFLPIVPLPTKYHLHFGEPLRFDGDPDDDDAVIEQKVAVVKQSIQSALHHGLKERKSIFW